MFGATPFKMQTLQGSHKFQFINTTPQKCITRQPLRHISNAYRGASTPSTSAEESYNMLDAFFIGRALAEVLNERLGAAVGDTIAEITTLQPRLRKQLDDIQGEVVSRARREMAEATTGTGSSGSGSLSSTTNSNNNNNTSSGSGASGKSASSNSSSNVNNGFASMTISSSGGGGSSSSTGSLRMGAADLGEAVDNLRAEVAAARAVVRQIRQGKQQKP